MDKTYSRFDGDKLAEIRRKAGLTREQIAVSLHISIGTVASYRRVNAEHLHRRAKAPAREPV